MQNHLKEVIDLYGDYLLRIAYTYVKDKRIAEEILRMSFLLIIGSKMSIGRKHL
ncbi:hypothetical protein QMK38_09595 [Lysinibacillus fusiformis]|nr:hypothetical protein [Lysinibacillus fusiformis]